MKTYLLVFAYSALFHTIFSDPILAIIMLALSVVGGLIIDLFISFLKKRDRLNGITN